MYFCAGTEVQHEIRYCGTYKHTHMRLPTLLCAVACDISFACNVFSICKLLSRCLHFFSALFLLLQWISFVVCVANGNWQEI